jgi:hypothetical protein
MLASAATESGSSPVISLQTAEGFPSLKWAAYTSGRNQGSTVAIFIIISQRIRN